MGFESMGWNPCYQALPNIKLLYPDPFPVRLNYDNLILNQIGIIRQFTIHAFLPIIIKTCNRWWIETCDSNRNFGTSSIWAPGNPPGFPSGISPEENSFQNMPRIFYSDSSITRIFPRISKDFSKNSFKDSSGSNTYSDLSNESIRVFSRDTSRKNFWSQTYFLDRFR